MAKQAINLGTPPAGSDGDTVRTGFTKANANFDELYLRAQGKLTKSIAGGAGTVALTAAEALNAIIELTGAITGNRVVTVPAATAQAWIVRNSTTGNYTVTFQASGGTGVPVPAGASLVLFSDGVNIVDLVSSAGSTEAGQISYFARTTPPPGYLKANGAAVSRITYAALFSAIGTTFGAGDGSATFNLPDLRAEFVRGWDDGRGVDASRAFGSWQNHALLDHSHNLEKAWGSGGGGGVLYTEGGTQVINTVFAGLVGSAYSKANETRPRNVALLACIRY